MIYVIALVALVIGFIAGFSAERRVNRDQMAIVRQRSETASAVMQNLRTKLTESEIAKEKADDQRHALIRRSFDMEVLIAEYKDQLRRHNEKCLPTLLK